MKLKFTLLFVIGFILSTFAQAPEKFLYQAVVRDANNNLLTNTTIGIKVSLTLGAANGTEVYIETLTAQTNENGLFTIYIGEQTPLNGVDWANGTYFINAYIDLAGGSNYTITLSSQMVSVPYALYAKTSGSSIPGPAGAQGMPGTNGVSISSIDANGDSLIIFYSDGNSQILADVLSGVGAPGINGTNGISISDVSNHGDSLIFTFSDANVQILADVLNGSGAPGINGTNGISISNVSNHGDSLIFTFSDSNVQILADVLNGSGAPGINGANGIDGKYISSAAIIPGTDSLELTFNDNSTLVVDNVKGADGAQGPQGMQGIQGVQGEPGVSGPQGAQGIAGMTLNLTTISATGTAAIDNTNQLVRITGQFELTLPANPSDAQMLIIIAGNTGATINTNGKNLRDGGTFLGAGTFELAADLGGAYNVTLIWDTFNWNVVSKN